MRPGRSLTCDCVVAHCVKGTYKEDSPRFSSQGCFHLMTSSPSKGFMATEFFMYSGNTLNSALPALSSPALLTSPHTQPRQSETGSQVCGNSSSSCCCVASVVSDSVRPHRWQPTRLPCPWDSPGKSTGVGCYFLLQCMKVKSESEK